MDPPASYKLFRHEPLNLSGNSFRLLDINGVSSDGLIECTVSQYNRDDLHLSYRTLSYEWGPQWPAGWILLNGEAFRVRQNLLSFLRSTPAHPEARKKIWIDAICIDQDNVFEKNHQVKQMAGIYRNAATVFAWLGAPDMDFFDPYFDMEVFLKSSYWGRMWIVQEITLAQMGVRLLFGKHSISWDEVKFELVGTKDLPNSRFSSHWNAVRVAKSADLLRKKSRPLTVLALLSELDGGGLCTDVRDKVYALLGMASDTGTLDPDYTIPSTELFFRVLKSEHSLVKDNTVAIDDVAVLCRALKVDFEDLRAHANARAGHGHAQELIRCKGGGLKMKRLYEHFYQHFYDPGQDVVLQCDYTHDLSSSTGLIDPLHIAFSFTEAYASTKIRRVAILREESYGQRYSCVAMAEYECFEEEELSLSEAASVKRCFFYVLPALQNVQVLKHLWDGSIRLTADAVLYLTKLVGTPPLGDVRTRPSDLRFLGIKSDNGHDDDLFRIRRRKLFRIKEVNEPRDQTPFELIADEAVSG